MEIKGIKVEADFAPHMLYVTNQDKPGFIGRFGATLAGAGINIALHEPVHIGRDGDEHEHDNPTSTKSHRASLNRSLPHYCRRS